MTGRSIFTNKKVLFEKETGYNKQNQINMAISECCCYIAAVIYMKQTCKEVKYNKRASTLSSAFSTPLRSLKKSSVKMLSVSVPTRSERASILILGLKTLTALVATSDFLL